MLFTLEYQVQDEKKTKKKQPTKPSLFSWVYLLYFILKTLNMCGNKLRGMLTATQGPNGALNFCL